MAKKNVVDSEVVANFELQNQHVANLLSKNLVFEFKRQKSIAGHTNRTAEQKAEDLRLEDIAAK
jgi:hypothetical protein